MKTIILQFSLFICMLLSVQYKSLAQGSNEQEYWSLSAHFKVVKIYKVPTKYMVDNNKLPVDSLPKCYLITIELMDTNCFPELANLLRTKKSFKGMKFSIVSIDSGFVCNDYQIKKKDELYLTISLWLGIWKVGGTPPSRHSLWPFEIEGYYIPNDKLRSQPMEAKELNGLCYSSNNHIIKP